MSNNIIRQDFGSLGNDVQTQMLIAPVLATMVSDRAYAVREQFIVDNVLYKITQAVSAAGVALVVGTNCEISDSITQQMKSIGQIQNGSSGDLTFSSDKHRAYTTISFPKPFNNIPKVVLTLRDPSYRNINLSISTTTTSGFTANAVQLETDSSLLSTTCRFDWIAIGD